MTQKEIDFVQEACFEKISRFFNHIIDNENELQELRKFKEEHEKAETKAEVLEEVKEKMKK